MAKSGASYPGYPEIDNPLARIFSMTDAANSGANQYPWQRQVESMPQVGGASDPSVVANRPQPAMPQSYPYSEFMRPMKDPREEAKNFGILDREGADARYNTQASAIDEQKKRFLMGQAIGALAAITAGGVAGNNGAQTVNNLLPALEGTKAMLSSSGAQASKATADHENALKTFYDSLYATSRSNDAIGKGNQEAAVELAKIARPKNSNTDEKIDQFQDDKNQRVIVMRRPDNSTYNLYPGKEYNRPTEAGAGAAANRLQHIADERARLRVQAREFQSLIGQAKDIDDAVARNAGKDEIARMIQSFNGNNVGAKYIPQGNTIQAMKGNKKSVEKNIREYDQQLHDGRYEVNPDLGGPNDWYYKAYPEERSGAGHSGKGSGL